MTQKYAENREYMIEKQHIESFLKANGVKPTASDEEIRSVLISARWENKEIDTALIVLKENLISHETHVDTLHKVFNTDSRLNSAEISALLGIHVTIAPEDVTTSVTEKRHQIEQGRIILSFLLAVFLAAGSVGYVFYRVHDPVLTKLVRTVSAQLPF
jgi:hypothetical protein